MVKLEAHDPGNPEDSEAERESLEQMVHYIELELTHLLKQLYSLQEAEQEKHATKCFSRPSIKLSAEPHEPNPFSSKKGQTFLQFLKDGSIRPKEVVDQIEARKFRLPLTNPHNKAGNKPSKTLFDWLNKALSPSGKHQAYSKDRSNEIQKELELEV